jgi:hypothetical protein
MDVAIELQGLDSAGRVVSQSSTRTEPRNFTGDRTWPFTVRLRPTGQEDRFALRVSHYRWRIERTGGGM